MNESIIIDSTETTPQIVFDQQKEIYEISGISRPLNAREFYDPVFNWVDNYINTPNKVTGIDLFFISINTASLKILLLLLEMLKTIDSEEKEVIVNWYYKADDDGLKEAGILLGEMSGLKTNIIPRV